eukprot:442082-Rhodomonas_salina.1
MPDNSIGCAWVRVYPAGIGEHLPRLGPELKSLFVVTHDPAPQLSAHDVWSSSPGLTQFKLCGCRGFGLECDQSVECRWRALAVRRPEQLWGLKGWRRPGQAGVGGNLRGGGGLALELPVRTLRVG